MCEGDYTKYFISEEERRAADSTCFFIFSKGNDNDIRRWQESVKNERLPYLWHSINDRCWWDETINISGELWDEFNLSELIRSVIEDFDYYGDTVVTQSQWDEIVKNSQKAGSVWEEVIAEATPWVNDCFEKCEAFTIMGL